MQYYLLCCRERVSALLSIFASNCETRYFTLCSHRLFRAGNFCPVCLKVYRNDESDLPMVCCDMCDRWVHTGLDKLPLRSFFNDTGSWRSPFYFIFSYCLWTIVFRGIFHRSCMGRRLITEQKIQHWPGTNAISVSSVSLNRDVFTFYSLMVGSFSKKMYLRIEPLFPFVRCVYQA